MVEGRQTPFDVDEVPDVMYADDHPDQDEVYENLFVNHTRYTLPAFDQMAPVSVNLSDYHYNYKRKRRIEAIRTLGRRVNLIIDDEYVLDSDDPHLLWEVDRHFLDFILVVGRYRGLGPLIPNTPTDHTFCFNLDLHRPYRQFSAKYGKLGFDPEHRMFYCGRHGNNEVWIGMRPCESDDGDEEGGLGTNSGAARASSRSGGKKINTCLKTTHQRALQMFLFSRLATLQDLSYQVSHLYGCGDACSLDDLKIKHCTNM